MSWLRSLIDRLARSSAPRASDREIRESLMMAIARWQNGNRRRGEELSCPQCGLRTVPMALYYGDTVNGKTCSLDPVYIHFSCECGYVFARQLYSEALADVVDKGWFDFPVREYYVGRSVMLSLGGDVSI